MDIFKQMERQIAGNEGLSGPNVINARGITQDYLEELGFDRNNYDALSSFTDEQARELLNRLSAQVPKLIDFATKEIKDIQARIIDGAIEFAAKLSPSMAAEFLHDLADKIVAHERGQCGCGGH